MSNPVIEAKNLKALLVEVTKRIKMAKMPLEQINGSIDKIDEIIVVLENIHENFVPLDIEEEMNKAGYESWKKLIPGFYTKDDQLFNELIETSKTLDKLIRKGVKLNHIYKYNNDELQFADKIGRLFNEIHLPLQVFKSIMNGQEKYYRSIRKFYQRDKSLFNELIKFKVIAGYALKKYDTVKKEYNPKPVSASEIQKMNFNEKLRYEFESINPEYKNLITGDWFNAFAYEILMDHLEVNRLNYELYTKVAYNAPPEIIRSDGDFDIIGKIENKIIMIECKSGKLTERDIDKVVQKMEDLKKVFSIVKSEIDEFVFMLVYNPHLPENKNIQTMTKNRGIICITPETIRGTVVKLFD